MKGNEKMKKFLASDLAIMMTLSLVACGETQTSTPTTEGEPIVEEKILPVELPTEFEISTGVYECGTDFAAGAYTMSINSNDGYTEYLCFESMNKYEEYQKTEKKENNAYYHSFVINKDCGYLEMSEGNVIVSNGSECTLKPWAAADSILPNGLYLVGSSLPVGSYKLKNASEYMTIAAVYESIDQYLEWFNSGLTDDPHSVSEFAQSELFLGLSMDGVEIALEDGQVLVIDGVASFKVF